jgi:hypothetical protein
MKQRIGLLIFVLFLMAPALSLACSKLGTNTHVGIIEQIDSKAGTLTLIDAESGKSITFLVSPNLLASLKPNNRVMINFKVDGKALVAEKIQI